MYRVSKSNCLLILSGLIGRNVQTLYQVVWSAGRSSQMARRPMTWWMLCSQRYRQADQWIRVEQSILMDRYYTYHIIHVYTIFGSHYLGLCISHERLNWKWTKELIIKAFRERERGERENCLKTSFFYFRELDLLFQNTCDLMDLFVTVVLAKEIVCYLSVIFGGKKLPMMHL